MDSIAHPGIHCESYGFHSPNTHKKSEKTIMRNICREREAKFSQVRVNLIVGLEPSVAAIS